MQLHHDTLYAGVDVTYFDLADEMQIYNLLLQLPIDRNPIIPSFRCTCILPLLLSSLLLHHRSSLHFNDAKIYITYECTRRDRRRCKWSCKVHRQLDTLGARRVLSCKVHRCGASTKIAIDDVLSCRRCAFWSQRIALVCLRIDWHRIINAAQSHFRCEFIAAYRSSICIVLYFIAFMSLDMHETYIHV